MDLRAAVARQGRPLARPVLWVDAAALAAALLLAAGHLRPAGDPTAAAGSGHHGPLHGVAAAGPGGWPPEGGVVASWGRWSLMVAAMMLPLVAPVVRRVAACGLWSRRRRTVLEFTGAYLVPWLLVGLPAVALAEQLDARVPALVAVLFLAALWHVAPRRRSVLVRCGAIRPMALRGRQASLDCARAGWVTGLRCIATCGPAMASMALAHSMILMAAVSGLLWTERARGPNPEERVGRLPHGLGFAVLALAAPVFA